MRPREARKQGSAWDGRASVFCKGRDAFGSSAHKGTGRRQREKKPVGRGCNPPGRSRGRLHSIGLCRPPSPQQAVAPAGMVAALAGPAALPYRGNAMQPLRWSTPFAAARPRHTGRPCPGTHLQQIQGSFALKDLHRRTAVDGKHGHATDHAATVRWDGGGRG